MLSVTFIFRFVTLAVVVPANGVFNFCFQQSIRREHASHILNFKPYSGVNLRLDYGYMLKYQIVYKLIKLGI